MKIEFDPEKSERNARDRELPFELVADFDFDVAWIVIDDREDYGEVRYRAIGPLHAEIVSVVFTVRDETMRVISLRFASRKERKNYDEKA